MNNKAISAFLTRSYPLVRKMVRRLMTDGNHADAEDITQEVMIRLLDAPIDQKKNPKAYLYKVISSTVADFYRKAIRVNRHRDDRAFDPLNQSMEARHAYDPDYLGVLTAPEEQAELWETFARLPKGDQELLLWLSQGMKYAEIAERLQCPIGTVKSSISCARARAKLVFRPAS